MAFSRAQSAVAGAAVAALAGAIVWFTGARSAGERDARAGDTGGGSELFAASSNHGSPAGAENNPFVGSWLGQNRVVDGTCSTGGEGAPTEVPFRIKADGPGLVLEAEGCAVKLVARGEVASLSPAPQRCTMPGGAQELSFESYRLELDGRGGGQVTSSAVLKVHGERPSECRADVRMSAVRSAH